MSNVEDGATHHEEHNQQRLTASAKPQKNQTCRFFNSKSGCRSGDACPYLHVRDAANRHDKRRGANTATDAQQTGEAASAQMEAAPPRKYQASTAAQSRVVARPTPKAQTEDPREFQLGQIRRRFKPKEDVSPGGTSLTFRMVPSDPDFPFDMEGLDCVMTVPSDYPQKARPKLRITNREMQRGFQLNVEQGFDELATSATSATLLGLMNRLDKDLANLLSRPMAQTIKIYRNVEASKPGSSVPPIAEASKASSKPASHLPTFSQSAPVFTSEQKTQAQTKRQADIRQLIARLGKLPTFKQATDGVTFTIPFTPLKKGNLPSALQNVNTIRLVVPELYNLVPCRVEFPGIKDDTAKAAEKSFEDRAKVDSNSTLLAHINYMSQHLGTMSAVKVETAKVQEPSIPAPLDQTEVGSTQAADKNQTVTLPDRSHIQVIPRPPEWAYARAVGVGGDDEMSEESSSEYDTGDETEDEDEEEMAATPSNAPTTGPAEKGILLSFPGLELYSIELLEMVSLSITVKCERCKEPQDMERLRNNTQGDHSGMKEVNCKKCANNIAAGYRMDLMHTNSSRAGYIDLDGCTPVDMLPSTFVPTCSECSTSYTTPGCISVRGESTLAICRECHHKMTFKIPEVKFLTISHAAERATRNVSRRKAKENLGIVAGQELPRRGRCSHYSKSYRWFRFSCCSKVFPCDKCHDDQTDHPNEHANRMICGYCSREQNYRPEDCGTCHSVLIGKKGHGFWEGGKGTRDKARMSKKDPRKYKRRPGTKPKGQWTVVT